MSIATILLVPAEGDQHGLLAFSSGIIGFRPPVMHCHPSGLLGAPNVWTIGYGRGNPMRGLLLAYNGRVVVEGCDRAYRCWSSHVYHSINERGSSVHRCDGAIYDALKLAQTITDQDWKHGIGGHYVILDAHGREVTP